MRHTSIDLKALVTQNGFLAVRDEFGEGMRVAEAALESLVHPSPSEKLRG